MFSKIITYSTFKFDKVSNALGISFILLLAIVLLIFIVYVNNIYKIKNYN